MIKVQVGHHARMTLQRPLKVPCLPVPYLDSRVVARGGKDGVERVEGDARHLASVALEDMRGGGAGQPV